MTVSTTLVLGNRHLREQFELRHLDTSDHRSGQNIARWDLENVRLALGAAVRLARMTGGPRGLVYVPLSQGTAGFLRDALLIHVARMRGWTIAGHLRGGEFHHYFGSLPRPMKRFVRRTLERVASVGAMGSSLRPMFSGIYPEGMVAVVPNGTPDPGLGMHHERDPDTVLFLSNLRRRKGVVEAVRAALLVLQQRPGTRFLFAGPCNDEELERELLDLAAPAGDAIRFLGPVSGEPKLDLVRSCGVLMFPPVEPEGHPRVVLEAIAAGTPLVTTDRGAIRETVVDGESAYVLDHPVPEQIAERLLRLLDDPALRERMGAAARRRYEAEFTQDRADEKLAGWLVELAGRYGVNGR